MFRKECKISSSRQCAQTQTHTHTYAYMRDISLCYVLRQLHTYTSTHTHKPCHPVRHQTFRSSSPVSYSNGPQISVYFFYTFCAVYIPLSQTAHTFHIHSTLPEEKRRKIILRMRTWSPAKRSRCAYLAIPILSSLQAIARVKVHQRDSSVIRE